MASDAVGAWSRPCPPATPAASRPGTDPVLGALVVVSVVVSPMVQNRRRVAHHLASRGLRRGRVRGLRPGTESVPGDPFACGGVTFQRGCGTTWEGQERLQRSRPPAYTDRHGSAHARRLYHAAATSAPMRPVWPSATSPYRAQWRHRERRIQPHQLRRHDLLPPAAPRLGYSLWMYRFRRARH